MIFLSFFLGDFSAYQNQITTLILLSVLSKLFFFLGTRLYVYLTRNEERSTMPNVVFLLLIACSLATIFVITTLINLSLTRNSISRKEEFGIMGSAIILWLSNILIFAAYRYIHKIHAQYTNLVLQQQKEENDRSYYESLREQFDRQRMMIHDIRHHLAAIKEMTAGDQGSAATQYITEMEGLSEFQRRSVY